MLLVIFGPPAVGKMAVGRALAAGGDWRLFHNHASIELLLPIFDYGSPPFVTLDVEIRRRVIQEAADAGTRLVFTFVWSLQDPADRNYVEALIAPYRAAGLPVAFVELAADLDTRLVRNRTPERLAAKPSKRDIEWSDANLRELEHYVLNRPADRSTAADGLLDRHPGIRIDTVGCRPTRPRPGSATGSRSSGTSGTDPPRRGRPLTRSARSRRTRAHGGPCEAGPRPGQCFPRGRVQDS